MSSNDAASPKPHAVCIAFPAQSHIKATLKLAKLLHSRGFHITFVNTEFNHNRFLKAKGPHALDGLPDFQFATIPDGLPPSDLDSTQDIAALCNSVRSFMIAPFRELVARLNDPKGDNPPVSCVVADPVPFATDVARELGIPSLSYWSVAACGFMACKQFRTLRDNGITPFKDESYLTNGYLDTAVEVPGMKNIRLRDLASFFQTTNPEDPIFHCVMEAAESTGRASALLVHSLDALEPDVLAALNRIYPDRVFPVGPMQLLLNRTKSINPSLEGISYSLWKEEPECLEWLDTKPANSVMYVSFGSTTTMSQQQLVELAMGLVNSDVSFLWAIRSDLLTAGDSADLPVELREKVERRIGYVSGWCPQEQVLNHPAVGGFLTHCGWGSMMESLTAGVPVLCWPFFGEQAMNCKFACTEWGIGMEMDKDVKREAVEKLVRELMNGDKGKEARNKAEDWAELAREATGPGGSSTVNLDRLIDLLLVSK